MKNSTGKDMTSPERIKWIMLATGILTALLFITSMFSIRFFPDLFKWLALGMIVFAVVFFIFRTINSYNETYAIRKRDKKG